LRVELAPAQVDALRQSLLELSSANLQVVVVPVDASESKSDRRQLQLDLIGQDRPGIVKEISQVLMNWNVNLEELHTECISAPMSGEKLFVATARLSMPDDVQMNAVCSALEQIAADLMADITLAPPSTSNVKRSG